MGCFPGFSVPVVLRDASRRILLTAVLCCLAASAGAQERFASRAEFEEAAGRLQSEMDEAGKRMDPLKAALESQQQVLQRAEYARDGHAAAYRQIAQERQGFTPSEYSAGDPAERYSFLIAEEARRKARLGDAEQDLRLASKGQEILAGEYGALLDRRAKAHADLLRLRARALDELSPPWLQELRLEVNAFYGKPAHTLYHARWKPAGEDAERQREIDVMVKALAAFDKAGRELREAYDKAEQALIDADRRWQAQNELYIDRGHDQIGISFATEVADLFISVLANGVPGAGPAVLFEVLWRSGSALTDTEEDGGRVLSPQKLSQEFIALREKLALRGTARAVADAQGEIEHTDIGITQVGPEGDAGAAIWRGQKSEGKKSAFGLLYKTLAEENAQRHIQAAVAGGTYWNLLAPVATGNVAPPDAASLERYFKTYAKRGGTMYENAQQLRQFMSDGPRSFIERMRAQFSSAEIKKRVLGDVAKSAAVALAKDAINQVAAQNTMEAYYDLAMLELEWFVARNNFMSVAYKLREAREGLEHTTELLDEALANQPADCCAYVLERVTGGPDAQPIILPDLASTPGRTEVALTFSRTVRNVTVEVKPDGRPFTYHPREREMRLPLTSENLKALKAGQRVIEISAEQAREAGSEPVQLDSDPATPIRLSDAEGFLGYEPGADGSHRMVIGDPEVKIELPEDHFAIFPGDSMRVSYKAPGSASGDAWVGALKATALSPSGDILYDARPDAEDLYQLVETSSAGHREGAWSFSAPKEEGDYQVRLYDHGPGGSILASTPFSVAIRFWMASFSVGRAPSPGGMLFRASSTGDRSRMVLTMATPLGMRFECARSTGRLGCILSQGRAGCTNRVEHPVTLERSGDDPVYRGVWRRGAYVTDGCRIAPYKRVDEFSVELRPHKK